MAIVQTDAAQLNVPQGLLIGGRWFSALDETTFDSINPANGEVLFAVARAGAGDVDRAVVAARAALEGAWRKVRPAERQRILLRLADLVEANGERLSTLDTLDMGAPIAHTRRMIVSAVDRLRWYAGQATAIHGDTIQSSSPLADVTYTVKEPVGVVGGITPWNGPIGAAIWKIGPVLATGCTLVLKPSEESPLSALLLGQLCLEAGVPEGVINVVTGAGDAGAALAAHPDVDKVAFTGSTATGREIVRASAGNLKRLSLELGGKSPNIVFADADLDAAAPVAAMCVFNNSGQICCAGTRLYVERGIYDDFTERVAEVGRQLRIGDGLDPETQIGPLVSERQLERVVHYFGAGIEDGARALSGGARLTGPEHAAGYFVPPTVFTDVSDDMRIAREEIFGPVISALPFDGADEIVARANATQFGLACGVWTTDLHKAHRLAGEIRAGTVWVNCYGAFDPAVPFGGYKQSGYGRENGVRQLDEYQQEKAIWINTA